MFIKSINNNNLWYLLDAKSQILGRFCTKIVYLLMGKNNYNYKSNIVNGGYVVVLNANSIILSGNKKYKKVYYKHSGYVGGLKCISYNVLLKKFPDRIIRYAVKGMLPKNYLGRLMLKRLKIYCNNYHKHIAQKLILIN